MATDFSNISISGRLGHDASVKEVGSTTVCEFSLANGFKVGRGEDQTAWYRCQIWGKRGESLAPHLTKGKLVIVGGSFTPREWETKEGEKRTSLDVNVNDLAFGGGAKNEHQGGSDDGGAGGWS